VICEVLGLFLVFGRNPPQPVLIKYCSLRKETLTAMSVFHLTSKELSIHTLNLKAEIFQLNESNIAQLDCFCEVTTRNPRNVE
jgi:hypothetical protein